jgi:hypothetical protein
MVETNKMETNMIIKELNGQTIDLYFRRFLSGAMIFMAAYFTTITVNASPPSASNPSRPDVIQLSNTGPAVVTGTVIEADENYVVIDSAGTQMRVDLGEVDLEDEADTVFKRGMDVTVEGEMNGHDFGTPIVVAKTITAREDASIQP